MGGICDYRFTSLKMKKLIYAVDDEDAICDLYECAVTSAGMDCKTFKNADELFGALAQERPDLIILDVMLDKMNGFEILEKIKNNPLTSDISVIMASAKNDEVSKVKGLNTGADDYLSKPFGVMELIARINANLRKRARVAKTSFKDLTVDDGKHVISVNGKELTLTLKQYNLLKELINGAETVLNRDDLLNKVWGYEYNGESRTLDIHIADLRKTLDAAGSAAEIVTVRGVGYTLK